MKAKNDEKRLALELRRKGSSYSQIRQNITVSKSTLSYWLRNFPLSKSQIDFLRGKNPQRIERFRNTMKMRREAEELKVFDKFKKNFGTLTKREKIIAGIFLYWGEGTKSASCTVAVTNTDPDALKFFVHWLNLLDVRNDQLSVALHLYTDMDCKKEMNFWSTYLEIPISNFRKPYIKKTRLCDITYKSGFKHGTCSVLFLNKKLYLYVKSGIKYVRMHA